MISEIFCVTSALNVKKDARRYLLFGQLSGHDSIRALERVFSQSDTHIQKLGFRPVCRSTLADANRTRHLQILENDHSRYPLISSDNPRQFPLFPTDTFHPASR